MILLEGKSIENIDFITEVVYGVLLLFAFYQHMVKYQNDSITKINSKTYCYVRSC